MKERGKNLIRAVHRAASSPSLRLGVFAVIALAAAWRPLGQAGALNEFRDAHLVHTYEEVAVRTVLEYGELPLWNPWSCGGMYALGNPQTRFASPAFLLSLVMGARPAEPVLLWLFLLLAMEGTFRFARVRNPSSVGPFLAAPFFALAGYGAFSWRLGWMSFLGGFLLVPWALYGVARLARGEVAGAAPVILSAGTMLGLGGSYPLALTVVFSALEALRALAEGIRRGTASRGAGLLVVAGLLTAGACAVRLWPVFETLRASPRIMAGRPGHAAPALLAMLFGPAPGASGTQAIFAVAPVAALFAIAALSRPRRAIAPVLIFAFAFWCATGHAGASPYTWLRQLPIFETLRYPERFLFPGIAYLAEAAGLGITAMVARARSPKWRHTRARAVGIGACALALVGCAYAVFTFDVLTRRSELGSMPRRIDQPFAQARGNRWIAGHFLALNRGSIACGEAYPVWMSPALRGDLSQEEHLEDSQAGTVRRVSWSPNRIALDVDAARPAIVRVNQNWHPGWRASVGEVLARDGLLAVSLQEGRHRVELSFRPYSAFAGACVSLTALAAAVAWMVLVRRWSRAAIPAGLMLGLLPMVLWPILAAASAEPRIPPRLVNADGSPLLVEDVPRDAKVPDVRFEVPVELLGVKIPEAPDEGGEARMELYWRVSGPVPRAVGIFVHLEGPDERGRRADHDVVGGTFFFKNAPRGRVLRDAFRMNTSDWEKGEWTVSLGLWNASGDGRRLRARTTGGSRLPDDKLEVGRIRVD